MGCFIIIKLSGETPLKSLNLHRVSEILEERKGCIRQIAFRGAVNADLVGRQVDDHIVAFHDEEDVGIDLESMDRDFSAVEKKALSEDEIDDLEDDRRNEQLAIYWCAKEAIFKRVSAYRVDFAEQIEVERFRPRG